MKGGVSIRLSKEETGRVDGRTGKGREDRGRR